MGSCGNLASASEPLCSGSEVAEDSVSEKLTGIKPALDSHESNVNDGQMRSPQATQHSEIEGDCSPGHCDKTSLAVGRDGQCTGKGGFECENLSEADASYVDREGLSGEICLGNVQNTDDMAWELISGIGCLDNPSDQREAEDGMCGDGSLLKGVNLVEKTADGLLDVEAGTKLIPSLIITGDVCCNATEATLESEIITEVVKGQDSPVMNDRKGSCPSETCANSMDEKVNDVAVVEANPCDVTSCSETSEMPAKNVLSSGCPDESSTIHENKNVSGLQIEAVEAMYVADMGNHKLASNETDVAADHSCPTDSLFHAVRETVQEDDRSAKCLSLQEAVTKVETETCIETPSFQITEMPVEEKTVLPLNHGKASDNNDTMTLSSLINETNLGDMIEADSRNDRSISMPHKMPYKQSRMPDCKTDSDQLNERRSGGPLSDMSAEMSGTEDVKNGDMSCQMLPSADNQGTAEGLHISSLLSNSAQVDGSVDSNGAPETYVECVKGENARPLDKFNDRGSQALQLKEVAFNFERLSEETLGLHSCEPHSTINDCSAKSLDDLDVPSVIVGAATTSSAANDYLSEKNDESKLDGRSECVPEIESPVVIPSSSRSSRINKSGRKTQAKRASRYLRNGSKVAPNYEALELIFKASKKKRTCCSKTRRSSTWGVMQSVSQHFEHMYELGIESAQKQGSRKVRIGQGQSGNQTGGTTQASKGKVGGSSNRIRLKVKMGKEVVLISEVVTTPAGAFASASCGGTSSNVANLNNDVKEKNQLDCLDAKLDIGNSYHGDSLVNEDPSLIAKDSAQDGRGCVGPTLVEIGHVRATFEDRYLGSETSPDSEVIDLLPEAQIGERHQEGVNSVALDSSKSPATCEDVLDSRKGKKKDKVPRQINCVRKDKSLSGSSSSKRRGCRVKVGESFNSGENASLFTSANRLSDSSRNTESLNLSSESDLALFKGSRSVDSGANTNAGQDICIGSMALEHSDNDLPSYAKKKGQKQVKSSKSDGVSCARSRGVNSTKSRKGASCKQNKDSQKSTRKSKVKEKGIYNHFLCKAEDHALSGSGGIDGDKKCKTAACMWTDVTSKSGIISNNLVEQQLHPGNAWVRCDDCHKWRRIAAALADSIEDANWTCKDNLDKSFADCSIPQEMSNADINAELELSDYSCEDDDYDGSRNYKELKCSRPTVSQQSSFIQIDSNKFLHRSRRTQTIDEVMVCHCKPPSDGKLGCGDECLNRMLNIECVQGTCPCGDLCSNQQFQKRKYAKLQWFRCGRKGYGLQLQEDVSKGDFIIEYVGEVLDIPTYEERQRDYAVKGHKHFYFMTLNGGEVIDACNKGNLGRFINHSCDPNCQTEKWMVNGEICIGLFAIRDIKKGEEVTFDYNYVRVFGAAAKKCVCGSAQCRGYIGGDLQSTETIVQGDSDDEFPEPVMLHEDGDVAYRFNNAIPQTVGGSDILVADQRLKDRSEVISELENTLGNKDLQSRSVSCISHSDRSSDAEGILDKALQSKPSQELSVHSKDAVITPLPELQRKISIEEDSSNLYHTYTPEMNEPPGRSVSDEKGGLAEVHHLGKIPKSSNIVKKSKGSSNLQNPNKGQGMARVFIKPKKAIEGSSNGRFEAVQEKLNELLDADGGISKRKDAPKGYLKLLLLTAASGDSVNGEAIQSNRDLSMILDAILKTRSRIVLMDIINKNGLRMLHNIMKQYRRDFKKIPILRKLLKVLEYLAVREILTLEHINVGPPCPGMESFRESILSLTEHDDKQVHQIARSFRDRWIPRHLRKVGYADRDDGTNRGLNFNSVGSQSNWQDAGQTRQAIDTDYVHQPSILAPTSWTTDNSSIDGGSTSGSQSRKRKTRWDSDTNPYLESLKRKEKSLSTVGDGKESNYEEDGPPGFSSPIDTSQVSSNGSSTPAMVDQLTDKVQYLRCPFDAVIGQPLERFNSRSPVSYGVPLLILQQFGIPQAGSMDSWAVAPGLPFHPFPPLPPFPRDRKRRSPPSSSDCGTNSSSRDHSSADEKKPENLSPSSYSANLADSEVPCSENQQTMPCKRLKGSSQDLGRRYFRQQKWNGAKMPPPWVRNCWRNNNPRGCSGPVPNEQRSSENAIDCKLGRDDSNYHQHMPPIQNHNH